MIIVAGMKKAAEAEKSARLAPADAQDEHEQASAEAEEEIPAGQGKRPEKAPVKPKRTRR